MPDNDIPSEPPPSYTAATANAAAASSSSANTSSANTSSDPSRLQIPGQDGNGIPAAYRRSMEDETRALPPGWIRQFDAAENHQFYVDTNREPPRSIWVHPYDDDEYLSTLKTEERERLEEQSFGRGHRPSRDDIMASHTDDDDEDHHQTTGASSSSELPPRPRKDDRTLGRKVKDKITGSTHEERNESRRVRAERERQLYHQHMAVRQAMVTAARTGQPQKVGTDDRGRDVYVEPPPRFPMGAGMGAGRMGGGYPGYGYAGGMGYSPYGAGGCYGAPNARYMRPAGPYGRPAGRGFGGGYGLPLALGGGLLGGAVLGDMMF